jgi:hypothetical protein
MSTRSTIAIENKDGSIEKVYCHFDGYLQHNGTILQNHYKTEAQVRLLIKADISGIDVKDGLPTPHHYIDPQKMFAKPYANHAEYVSSIDSLFHEFNYLFRKNGKWEVIEGSSKGLTGPKSLARCVSKLKKPQTV